MSRIRIGKDSELSSVARSLVVTDAANEQMFLAPGTNNQILTIVAGVPTWVAAPADVVTTLAYNGATGVLTYTDELGATTNLNLPLEKFLASAALDTSTNILTFTLNDGTTVAVNMTDYLGYTFNISDAGAVTQTISVGDTINFLGANGFTVDVSATDTVTITPPAGVTDGDVMTWNATLSEWVSSAPVVGSFTVLGNSGPGQTINNGDTLRVGGVNGFTAVTSATDAVDIKPPLGTATGQVMTWNNTTLVWEATTPASGSTFTVAGTSGTNQVIAAGDTMTLTGIANGILIVGGATDTLTFSLREQMDNFSALTSGTTVTATQTPIATTLRVYRNGMRKQLTVDYTVSGTTITFVEAFGVSSGGAGGETVELDYRY